MRATFLLAGIGTFGGDRVIARYAHGLAALDWEVELLSLAPPNDDLFYRGLPLRHLDLEGFPTGRGQYLASLPAVLRALPRPGVVVATWTPTLAPATVLRATGRASRTVWLQQDYPEMFRDLPVEEWLLRHGSRLTDVTIAVSDACALHAGGAARGVHTIHSGVDSIFFGAPDSTAWPPRARPVAARGTEDPPRLLFVGDPIDRKGWPELVEALALLALEGLHPELYLVTRRPPPAELPPGTRIEVGLSDAEMAGLYRRVDLLVCASRAEGWGLPALEAMAAGTPALSTLHSGCSAYARPGENLIGVPIGNPRALADGIRRGVEDLELRTRLVAGGLRTAERFSWPRAIRRFEALLRGRDLPTTGDDR